MTHTITPTFTVPRTFGYAPPVSDRTIREWQAELDRQYYKGPRGMRLLVLWEPGDPWQPIDRWFLWIAVDPSHHLIEPWNITALRGPNPRSKGHYCGDGYCLCDEKRGHWVGGATRFITGHQWRIYRETGLYATPWWIIQGNRGGHRYRWDKDELASVVSGLKGFGHQPPMAGDLPYAPFDQRVLRAIRAEHNASKALKRLQDRKAAMALEDRDQAEAVAKALWDWTGNEAEALWNEGGEAIPQALEMEYGRAPVGHQINWAQQERMTERSLTRRVE